MKKSHERRPPIRSNATVGPISDGVDSRLRQSERRTRDEIADFDGGVRAALSKQLHDLLNSLWLAALRIELSSSDETCPPKFRETLEELGRCVEEAMTTASQASTLVGPPTSERAPS